MVTARHGRGLVVTGYNVLLNIAGVLEGEFLPGHLIHDAFAVVVAKTATQFVIVHAWLVLACTPQVSYVLRSLDLKLVAVSCPMNEMMIGRREEKV